ncbi:MAG: NAD-dependent 4,6-dehydratase LegB [Pseudomonadales bacterium]
MPNSQNILVTGADGFIGSHLTEMLAGQGHNVKALSQYNSFNNWGWLEGSSVLDQIEIVSGDVRDPAFCRTLCQGIDTVYHLAALIAIPFSYSAPQSYVDTNVSGTLNMCQAALDNGVQKFIHTSTSEVYGTAQYVPIDESHPMQAQSPYSASKIAADAVATSFHSAFELPLVIARPFNTFGPRQSARAVIPTIILQLAAGESSIALGDLSPTRDFNYVQDTCRGFIALANSEGCTGKAINIGSNQEISIGNLLNLIAQMMGKDTEVVTDPDRIRPAKSEVFRLWCDNSLITELTDFQPAWALAEGLQQTIDWFLDPKNASAYKSGIYNV